jgi:hypothetical protein
VEWKELEFVGDAIKVFFFVFIDVGKDVIVIVTCIFNGEDVVEGEVGA